MTELLEQEKQAFEIQKDPRTRRVCFVCTGNTCRSPMAEVITNYLARRARQAGDAAPTVEAISRGLYANEGEAISYNTVRTLEKAGIEPQPSNDYRRHTARTLTEEEALGCDLLVGMSMGHVLELMMRFPQMAQRIVCMPAPINDPFGGDEEVYRACFEEIFAGVQALLFSEVTE